MSRTFSLPEEAAAYLDALRLELADLPPDERDDLLADVETSLAETADEPGAVVSRLGSPREFALELRAAAGLGARPLLETPRAADRLAAALRRILASPRTIAVCRALDRLAPIGWAARGYVAVAALALATSTRFSSSHPEIPRFGDGGAGLLVVVVAVAVSIWLGLRANRVAARRTLLAANAVLVLAAIPVVVHLARGTPNPPVQAVVVQAAQPQGLAYDGTPLRNLYPYGRDGRLLHDVLLYDDRGDPLDVGGPAFADPDRRVLVTPDGKPIFNSFPIRYFEPGTRTVAHPDASPPVKLPRIATPPLRSATR